MTTLNTIIEEENDALERKIGDFTFNNGGALELTLWNIVDERVHKVDEVGIVIQDHLTTAMQRASEHTLQALQDYADKYELEEVRKAVEEIRK